MSNKIQTSTPESIEATAFAKGAHNEPLDDLIEEIEAEFEKLTEERKLASVDEIKRLEAAAENLRRRKDEATARWEMIDGLHEKRMIEFSKPLIAVIVAVLLVIAEGQVLAPTMDGLNLTDPLWQFVVASVIVAALSGIIEIAIHNFNRVPQRMWLVIAAGTFGIGSLVGFGWWRGEEAIFAARQFGNAGFAAEFPTLTRVVVTTLTLALPITAAFALDFGVKRLRLWLERFTARNDFHRFAREAEESRKNLEAARERLEDGIAAIAQQREAWVAAARDNFDKGRAIGAWKLPFWQAVILPTAIAAILTFVIVMILGLALIDPILTGFIDNEAFRISLLVLLTLGITGIFAMVFIRRWNRPTDAEKFRQRATHFRNAVEPNALRLNEGVNRPISASPLEIPANGHQPVAVGPTAA